MFKKIFNRSTVPTKSGTSTPKALKKLQFINKYELELINMDENPLYTLTHQLTIGSEIGNIIIADATISPRHASFILQDQVVSLIDHGSISGTFVNGSKISPGKYIILGEEDIILIGELEVKLHMSKEAAPEEIIPEVPAEVPLEIPEKKKFDPKEHLKANSKKKVKKKTVYRNESSANAIIRVVAMVVDLLITYITLVLFTPFDDFKNLIAETQNVASDLFIEIWEVVSPYLESFGFVEVMFKDFYTFASNTFHFEPILIIFFLTRFLSTLVFGVSIGQYLVGIKGGKSPLWNRVGGGLRVALGVITGPFLIFDMPAILSRRTFKEILSFTRIEAPSRLKSLFLGIFIPALMISLGVIAPLFQGLELTEPIAISESLDKRIKVKNLENEEPKNLVLESSQSLGFELSYEPKELILIPNFSFLGSGKKISLKNNIIFYQTEFKRGIEFEVLKTFDLKQLLGVGLKSDPFLKDKFPALAGFAFSNAKENPNFKNNNQKVEQDIFVSEFVKFTQLAFTLSIDNFFDVFENDTYLLKGLVDYKTTFLSLIEYKDFNEVGYIKIGNGTFLRFVYSDKQMPFDILIPISKGEGKIFKVTWPQKDGQETSRTKFYKYNLSELNLFPIKTDLKKPELSALSIYDLFSKADFKKELENPEVAQSLYGHYYETSGKVLLASDEELLELWRSKVSNLLKIFQNVHNPDGNEMKTKLIENFKDLDDALSNKNFEYFGVSQSVTI